MALPLRLTPCRPVQQSRVCVVPEARTLYHRPRAGASPPRDSLSKRPRFTTAVAAGRSGPGLVHFASGRDTVTQ
jgi:hypothetical protein